jgi:hypothetical protein
MSRCSTFSDSEDEDEDEETDASSIMFAVASECLGDMLIDGRVYRPGARATRGGRWTYGSGLKNPQRAPHTNPRASADRKMIYAQPFAQRWKVGRERCSQSIIRRVR